jgi:hypothetical protein
MHVYVCVFIFDSICMNWCPQPNVEVRARSSGMHGIVEVRARSFGMRGVRGHTLP